MASGQPVRLCRCGTRLARTTRGASCSACEKKARDRLLCPPQVPASFWDTEQMQAALTSCDMGAVIYAYRTHPWHGTVFSQETVARWGGITQSRLSRLETGQQFGNFTKLIRWADILGIPAQLRWFSSTPPIPVAQERDQTLGPEHTGRGRSPQVMAILAMSHAFQSADRRVGGGELYDQVRRYLRTEIGPRLVEPEGCGADLFAAAASLTECAGWMAHDCGRDQRARTHFDSAFRLATAADNGGLAANVCASMSHLARQLRQADHAVRIAEAGLSRARPAPGTIRLRARLHAMKARGLALDGNGRECRTALGEAARVLAGAGDQQPAEWITGFDDASLASEAASCMRELGDLGEAERQAKLVIQLRAGDRVRSRAFGQLILARVLTDANRVDEAAAVGLQVCAVAPTLTSTRVRVLLDDVAAALHTHRSVAEVQTFLAVLAATRRSYGQHTDRAAVWPV